MHSYPDRGGGNVDIDVMLNENTDTNRLRFHQMIRLCASLFLNNKDDAPCQIVMDAKRSRVFCIKRNDYD